MEIRDYQPLTDAAAVFALWNLALANRYPVTERVFSTNTLGRPSHFPGDSLVAVVRKRIVGFVMAEYDRRPDNQTASLAAIIVHPDLQRRGLGTALLAALSQRLPAWGCRELRAAAGPNRFWSGVPVDLEGAVAFLRAQGFALEHQVWDLLVPLADYRSRTKYQDRFSAAGVTVVGATCADLPATMAMMTAEFPGWLPSLLRMAGAGDLGNVLLVKRGDEVLGCIQTYTPASRWRGANLVWEAVLGESMGGFGAVGIVKAWRGRGLGAAMCEAAALHVADHGGTCCLIDWTGLVEFYAKIGAAPWRRFLQGPKLC